MRLSSRREAAIARVVSASDLYEAFHTDRANAEPRYREQMLAVTGRIDYVGKTDAGELYLALAHGHVVFVFEQDCAASLTMCCEGKTVIVTGRCRGLIADVVVLASCQVHEHQ